MNIDLIKKQTKKSCECEDVNLEQCFDSKSRYIKKLLFSNEEKDKKELIDSIFNFNQKFAFENNYIWYWYTYNLSKDRGKSHLAFGLDIPRTTSNIKKIFENYKTIVFAKIDKNLYEQLSINITVKDLLKSYELFRKKVNFQEIENLTFRDDVRKYFTLIAYPDSIIKKYGYPPFPNYGYKSWLYSFWYRRYLEGNMETVYQILQEIDEHYEKQK